MSARGSSCACGGRCPKCSAGVNRAGNANADPAPLDSRKPIGFVDELVRWVRYKTVSGPTYSGKGVSLFFQWAVDLETSLQYGYVVQHIQSEWWAENCDGTPFTGYDVTKEYWERWHFENGKNVTAKDRTTGADDTWSRGICDQPLVGQPCPAYPKDTRGIWVISGELYIVPDFDLDGFSSSAAGRSPAGNLDHSLTKPARDLGKASGRRTIGGVWDFCGSNNTHTRV